MTTGHRGGTPGSTAAARLLGGGGLVAVLPPAVSELLVVDLVLEPGHSDVERLRWLLKRSLQQRMLLLQSLILLRLDRY